MYGPNQDDDFSSRDHFFFGDPKQISFDDDDFFKKAHEEHAKHFIHHGLKTMEWVAIFFSVFGFIVFLIIICKCCARRRNDGHVINAPPTVTAAPYPQQQYATVVTYPVAPYAGAFPQPGMQVVTTAAYPTAYPTVTAYPATAAPYPPGPSAYPHPAPAPYPTAGYPHPQPDLMPQPYVAAPSAPDANALPPSYDQATGTGYNKNSTPFNPSYGNV